ncbi:MAG: hypothetical protein HY306_01280 [Nitrosomonadales bacterium]|nr:hypothetical protein [Nitrosomonadales bacterium]
MEQIEMIGPENHSGRIHELSELCSGFSHIHKRAPAPLQTANSFLFFVNWLRFCYTARPAEVMEGIMEKALFVRAEWNAEAEAAEGLLTKLRTLIPELLGASLKDRV